MKNTKHTVTDQEIVHALLEHVSQEKAAAFLEICTATIRRRLDRPACQDLYLRARCEQNSFLRARAQQDVPSVLHMFAEIMADTKAKAGDKLLACKALLKHANTFELEHLQSSLDDMQERIENKEQMMWEGPRDMSRTSLETKGTVRKKSASAAKIDRIVFAMLQYHGNRIQAAVACDMSRETLWRWWQKPEVKAQYRKELNAIYLRGMAMMQQAAATAYVFIHRMMKATETRYSVRIQCGDTILCYARKGVQVELRDRKDALDARTLILEGDVPRRSPGMMD